MNNNNKIDLNSVKNMYNEMQEIWPRGDLWYQYTYSQISRFLKKVSKKYNFTKNMDILNAGSGGNSYDVPGKHYHVDIAEQKLKNIPNSYIENIENLSFPNKKFDVCICVGSVLNYCDALAALAEISRVLKHGGILILDYDQSHSFEFIGTPYFNQKACIIETFNSGYIDKTWIYSPEYISSILRYNNFNILDTQKYHIITLFIYRITHNENMASAFSKFDKVVSYMPILRNFSCNLILCSQKI